jgi:hypothetical protein
MGCLLSIYEPQAAEAETPGLLVIEEDKIKSYYLEMQRPGLGETRRPDNKRARSKIPRSR